MGLIALRQRLTSQPQYPVKIDFSNPITKGIKGGTVFSNKSQFDALGNPLTYNSTLESIAPSTGGVGLYAPPGYGSHGVFFPLWTDTTGEASLVIRQKREDTAPNHWLELASDDGPTFDHFTYSGGVYTDAFWNARWINGSALPSGKVETEDHVIVLTVKDGEQKAYFNGQLWVSDTQTGGFVVSASGGLGGYLPAWDTEGFRGWIYEYLLYERVLTAPEAASLSANIHQVWKAQPRRIWVSAAAGGAAGTVTKTNASDSVSASGSPIVSGVLAKTNGNDSIAAAGSAGIVSGTLAKTNANDTVAASGKTTVTGSLARSNVSDTVSASGTTSIIGSLAKTNANDSISAAGSAGAVSGTLARSNANDTVAASGTATVSGSLSKTGANDSVAASGSTTVKGSISSTNASDTCTASGSVGSSVSGSLSRTNANDSVVASGSTSVAGTLARTNTNDAIAASGTTTVIGALSKTNVNDSVAASGSMLISGSLTYTNSNDTVAAAGVSGDINTISSIVERTALFRATAARSAKFQRSKSVTVKFN